MDELAEAIKAVTVAQRLADLEARVAALEEAVLLPNDDISALQDRLSALEAKPNNRGTRLPDSWQPCEDERKYAMRLGLQDGDIVKAVGSFKAYWCDKTGPNATKKSWTRTWQEWCRKDAERLGRTPQDAPGSAEGGDLLDHKPEVTSKHTEAARTALEGTLLGDELERHRMARQIRAAYVRTGSNPEHADVNILCACGKMRADWLTGVGQAERAARRAQELLTDLAANLPEPIGRERFAWPDIERR